MELQNRHKGSFLIIVIVGIAFILLLLGAGFFLSQKRQQGLVTPPTQVGQNPIIKRTDLPKASHTPASSPTFRSPIASALAIPFSKIPTMDYSNAQIAIKYPTSWKTVGPAAQNTSGADFNNTTVFYQPGSDGTLGNQPRVFVEKLNDDDPPATTIADFTQKNYQSTACILTAVRCTQLRKTLPTSSGTQFESDAIIVDDGNKKYLITFGYLLDANQAQSLIIINGMLTNLQLH